MDWNNVTWWELASALREAEWQQGPQPVFEFVQPARFSLPKSRRKWSARIKNNLFYYHVNYLLVLAFVVVAAFLRHLWALPAIAAAAASLAVQNDTFAASLSEAVLRAVRRVNDRAASRLRRATGGDAAGGMGHPLPGAAAGRVRICGLQRRWVSAGLAAAGAPVLFRSGALPRLATALLSGGALMPTPTRPLAQLQLARMRLSGAQI